MGIRRIKASENLGTLHHNRRRVGSQLYFQRQLPMLEIIMKIFNSTNLRKNDGYMKKMITEVN